MNLKIKTMKKVNCVFLAYILCNVYSSCNPGNTKDFIPGTYVREVNNEFSTGKDTLVIATINDRAYTILHKGSYQRIKDGELLPVKSMSENWSVTYDDHKQILIEAKRGKVISFDPARNILFVGSSLYKKIK
jgi:hypothetical protein